MRPRRARFQMPLPVSIDLGVDDRSTLPTTPAIGHGSTLDVLHLDHHHRTVTSRTSHCFLSRVPTTLPRGRGGRVRTVFYNRFHDQRLFFGSFQPLRAGRLTHDARKLPMEVSPLRQLSGAIWPLVIRTLALSRCLVGLGHTVVPFISKAKCKVADSTSGSDSLPGHMRRSMRLADR